MIKTEPCKSATRIYSTENKLILDKKTGQVHSEYVLEKCNIEDYVELEPEKE